MGLSMEHPIVEQQGCLCHEAHRSNVKHHALERLRASVREQQGDGLHIASACGLGVDAERVGLLKTSARCMVEGDRCLSDPLDLLPPCSPAKFAGRHTTVFPIDLLPKPRARSEIVSVSVMICST